MSNRHAPGLEPYDAKEFGVYLTRAHGARLVQQNGSHLRARLDNGVEVPLPLKGYVPRLLAKTVAARLGISYHDLRAGLGHPIVNGHRSRGVPHPTRPPIAHATKDQILDLLAETRRSLIDLERWVRSGQHDPALYDRLYAALRYVQKKTPGRDGRLNEQAP